MRQNRHLLFALIVFTLSLTIRLPFATHPTLLHNGEAEYLDLARYFAMEGLARSCLNGNLLCGIQGERWAGTSYPLLLPLTSGGILNLATYFHGEPEKFIANEGSWKLTRIFNAFIGSIAVVVWFGVAASLTSSSIWAFLFAFLLATNPSLVQNSAMNMPEQWLLLLTGLAFLCWQQKQASVVPIIFLAFGFGLLVANAISPHANEPSFPKLAWVAWVATYPLSPFWWLLGAVAWLSGNRRALKLLAGLIVVPWLPFFGLSSVTTYARWGEIIELTPILFFPALVALPFILPLLLWRRFSRWESEGALWAGIGGAIASLAPHARPEGLLLALAVPFVLTNGSHRLTALLCWLLGLIWSLLIFAPFDHLLPSSAWFLLFHVLDFPTDSWRLYGQLLPSFWEFVFANYDGIVERILAKAWALLLHLAQNLSLLLFVIPLAFWFWKAKKNLGLHSLAKALPFIGLLFFTTHCFVWSTPPEPRLILVPLVLFTLWLFYLWLRWLQTEKFAFRLVALFVTSIALMLTMNSWGLIRTWQTQPQWHPEALKLAANMTRAMVTLDPMEEAKLSPSGIVSNMPWLLFLHARSVITLMPLLDTPEKLDAFISRYKPEAFILLLYGRTPEQAVAEETRAGVWLIWQGDKLQLRPEWSSRLELVDWRLFRNRECVNIVAMLVAKEARKEIWQP